MIDYREIENLIKALDESSLTSLEIQSEGLQINIKKENNEKVVYMDAPKAVAPIHVEPSIDTSEDKVQDTQENNNFKAIKSPIVGTFYSKPAPDKDSYVKAGDSVKCGQVVCIVEAMKLMNEVKSDFSGEIVKVLVEDGDLLEYGQEIFLVKEN